MGSEHIEARRSKRLNYRWVTLHTGLPPSKACLLSDSDARGAASIASKFGLYSDKFAEKVPIDRVSDLADIEVDISLPRTELRPDIYHEMDERVETIEADVSALKLDVSTINGKLDDVLQAMARLAPNPDIDAENPNRRNASGFQPQQSAPLNKQAAAASQTRETQTAPNPHQSNAGVHHMVGTQMSLDDFVHRESQRDKFEINQNGRYTFSTDALTNRVMAKPYMYISREGISTIKQKLEVRQSATPLEYIDATLALLADPRAFDTSDYVDIMYHLRKVTRDSLERSWPSVRRWSQYVWDAVETGEITWADREQIQEERVRLCLTNPLSSSNSVSNKSHSAPSEVICRQFNTRIGCKFPDAHGDSHTVQLHCCSYCDSVGKQCYHSVRECERRLAHTRNDTGHPQQRQRRQQFGNQQNNQFYQRNSQQQFNPYAYNGQHQSPKNAM